MMRLLFEEYHQAVMGRTDCTRPCMKVGRLLRAYCSHPGEMEVAQLQQRRREMGGSRNAREIDTIGLVWVIEYQRKRESRKTPPTSRILV